MKKWAGVALVLFALTACGGGSSGKTVEFDWSGAGDIRGDARAGGIAECFSIDDSDAATECTEKYAEKVFNRKSAAAKAKILKAQCAAKDVGNVTLTWEDFDGNNTTSTEDCP